MEYGKIETLFERNEKFVVDPTKLKSKVIATINEWSVTEKIDGTNMRVTINENDENFVIQGRTDRATMPGNPREYVESFFNAEKLKEVMNLHGTGWEQVVLYGEWFGAGIQSGGYYRKDKAFRLFDVLVSGKWWLDWSAVEDIAEKLGIKTVPYLGQWTLDQIVDKVKEGIPSIVAQEEGTAGAMAEGIVARPIETLFDKKGSRLIIKLKTKDFGKQKN